MIDLNVGTLTDFCRAVAPAMIERKSGGILNVASTAAFQPGPNMAVYFATKAFVLSLSEALHEELKPHGVQGHGLVPRPDPNRVRRRRRLWRQPPVRPGRDGIAAEVVEAGLDGLDKNQAVVVPGWVNKIGAASTRFAAALGGSQNRRGDQILSDY